MNLPNKLTVLRVLFIPLFVVLVLVDAIPHHDLWGLIVFALASLTDLLDGNIARRKNLVTDFGKFMDPLADKMLVMSALVCFVERGLVIGWVVILILAREFLVTSLRLVAAGSGKVIAADRFGKIKTVCQMISILAILLLQECAAYGAFGLFYDPAVLYWVGNGLMFVTLFFTLLSGANYLYKNLHFVRQTR